MTRKKEKDYCYKHPNNSPKDNPDSVHSQTSWSFPVEYPWDLPPLQLDNQVSMI